MQLYKIQQFIELLKEYNDYFFAGSYKPCIYLIEDANQHKTTIIKDFIEKNIELNIMESDVIKVENVEEFINQELI